MPFLCHAAQDQALGAVLQSETVPHLAPYFLTVQFEELFPGLKNKNESC